MNSPEKWGKNSMNHIYPTIVKKQTSAKKMLAVLIDPDKAHDHESLTPLLEKCQESGVDFIFVGGSRVPEGYTEKAVNVIKEHTHIPVLLFPGHSNQISQKADALLFLSLISGRNPEFLIGHHIKAAPQLKKWGLESIPTGYILIDGGKITSVAAVSQTVPLPADEPTLIANTALAGQFLGMKLIYLEAGSGALEAVSSQTIRQVKDVLDIPLIVGGGINTADKAAWAWAAGADLIVMGNSLEREPALLEEVLRIKENYNNN